jgi:SAM-dependent methyltransferase
MDEAVWWDSFHSKFLRTQEWYLEADEALPFVLPHLIPLLRSSHADEHDASRRPAVLHIGCGTSALGEALAGAGFDVVNVDFSAESITWQRERAEGRGRKGVDGEAPAIDDGIGTPAVCSYHVADARDLSLVLPPGSSADAADAGRSSFAAVVDKGTLDAVLASRTPDTLASARAIVAESLRVLRGRERGLFLFLSIIGTDERLADLQEAADLAAAAAAAAGGRDAADGGGGAPAAYRVTRLAVPLAPLEKPEGVWGAMGGGRGSTGGADFRWPTSLFSACARTHHTTAPHFLHRPS